MKAFYENIKKLSENSQVKEKEKPVITQEEQENIDFWISEMARHIELQAKKGLKHFVFDCSRMERYLFLETAHQFKQKYYLFYVLKDGGRQYITIRWSEDYES